MFTKAARQLSKTQQLVSRSSLNHGANLHVHSVAAYQNAARCLDMLRSQQCAIAKSLNAFDGWRCAMHSTSAPTPAMLGDLHRFGTFFKEYTEDIHFAMEEKMVFPFIKNYMRYRLLQHHHQQSSLRSDHDTARQYILRIMHGSESDLDGTLQAISELVSFLSVHGQKTEHYLYPDIVAIVPDSVMEEVSSQCEEFMLEHREREEQLLQICDELDRKYHKQEECECSSPAEKPYKEYVTV